MGGFRGGGGQGVWTSLENYKWLKVSLEILVWTPSRNCFLERSIQPSVKYVED